MKSARPPKEASALDQRRNDTAQPDLFAADLPAVIPALWPNKGTRKADALAALIAGPQNQCDYRPGWRLAAYVQSLEYDGWSIRSRLFKHPRCARPIAEYTLDRQAPATAAALERRNQAGYVSPEHAGLLVALAVPAATVIASLARFLGWA